MELSVSKSLLKKITLSIFILILTIFIITFGFMNNSTATSLTMGAVEINVNNLDSMKDFYEKMAGLNVISSSNTTVELGDNGEVIIKLIKNDNLKFAPVTESGLYHTAIVYPTRKKLAEAINRILTIMPNLYQGSSDHLVSEAFYFSDPEGNGVELYFDKPRSDWQYDANGKPLMDSIYIDERAYVTSNINSEENKDGIKMGHIHLKVGNIDEARKFYAEILLFDIISRREHSLFISRDGYHHHLGMNTWQSLGSGVRTKDTYGLKSFELKFREKNTFQLIKSNLKKNGSNITEVDLNNFITEDPWGTEIKIKLV